jgi:hypothetical protein
MFCTHFIIKMTLFVTILSIFSSFDWLIYLAMIVILGLQIWLISKTNSITKQRKRIRLALNLFLWLVVLLFVIQPQWKSSANRVLLISENIPSEHIKKIKDSLKITEVFSNKEVQQRLIEDPTFVEHLGYIYLLGRDFTPEILSNLSMKQMTWLPFFEKDELQDIHWKGIVRKDDIQEIAGEIELSEEKMLKVNYENQILDSILLKKGFNNFHLRFPTFSIGRTETELLLGETPLQKVIFFSRKNPRIAIQFILENPDFESKTLAEWLGKNGNYVEITTTVAKNKQNQISINKQKSKEKIAPDIIITDPRNASNQIVKKAIFDGKSVLFLNLTNPEQELKIINLALGSRYFAKKITNEDFIKISENLTGLPYHFEEKNNQKNLIDYPVAIQRNFGKTGVSLLNETFPLKLSGDSVTYNKLWTSVFQQLNPSFHDNIEVAAPIFQDTKTTISLNNRSIATKDLKIGNDTTQVESSAINSLSSETDFVFRKTGWQSLQDSSEVYVEDNATNLSRTKQINELLIAHSKYNNNNKTSLSQTLTSKLPDWLWLLIILLCLVAVWIEPKLRF